MKYLHDEKIMRVNREVTKRWDRGNGDRGISDGVIRYGSAEPFGRRFNGDVLMLQRRPRVHVGGLRACPRKRWPRYKSRRKEKALPVGLEPTTQRLTAACSTN